MKFYMPKIYVIFVLLFIALQSLAQEKTLFFMGIHPQSNLLNPAVSFNYSFFALSFSPDIFVENSTFVYNDLLISRIENNREVLYWDFENIDKKIKDKNFLNGGLSFTPIYFGLELRNTWFFNAHVSVKNTSFFHYPGTISSLRFGNADVETGTPRTIDLNNYSINEQNYIETSVGFSKEISKNVNFGFHVKALTGISNLRTKKFLAEIETANDFSTSTLRTDALVDISGTLFNTDKIEQAVTTNINPVEFLAGKKSVSVKNLGAAFDLGFQFKMGEKITGFASVTDLGAIRWGNNPQQLISKGEYTFDGLYFSTDLVEEALENDDFLSDYLEQYTDTIINTFFPETGDNNYTTWLYPQAFLGTSWEINRNFSAHVLMQSKWYPKNILFRSSLGASVSTSNRKLAFSSNVSYSNYTLYNIGFGALFNGRRAQLFVISDNINSINIRNSKGINLAFGINILLWKQAAIKKIKPVETLL